MASLNISELQFAFTFFAKFSELFKNSFQNVVVPSTVMEGKDNYAYNGTDLVLDNYFFQFKKPALLQTNNAREARNMRVPYFRFSVKNKPALSSHSQLGQLDFLINHASNVTNNVYYVAPWFDLNSYNTNTASTEFWYRGFYQSHPQHINDFCAFIRIPSINPGWVPNDDSHHICYNFQAASAYFFSEPKEVRLERLHTNIDVHTNLLKFSDVIEKIKGVLIKHFKLDDYKHEAVDDFRLVQELLLTHLNVIYQPILLPRAKYIDSRINNILNE